MDRRVLVVYGKSFLHYFRLLRKDIVLHPEKLTPHPHYLVFHQLKICGQRQELFESSTTLCTVGLPGEQPLLNVKSM
jgi:hypothetical protein